MASLAAVLVVLFASHAYGQSLLQKSFPNTGDAKPVRVYADEISTWKQGDHRLFLLRGQVWIEHGLVSAQSADAVLWVDEKRKKETGLYHVKMYGERDVVLKDGTSQETAQQSLFEWTTRGEIRIKARQKRVIQSEQLQDPTYLRGAAIVQSESKRIEPQAAQPAKFPVASPPPNPPNAGVVNTAYLPEPDQPNEGNIVQLGGVVRDQKSESLPGVPPSPNPPETQHVVKQAPSAIRANSRLTIRPRSSEQFNARNFPLPNGENALVITSGVIVTATDPSNNFKLIDIEADRLVLWTKGSSKDLFNNANPSPGSRSNELYLSGHVEIRHQTDKEERVLRADEVYYDLERNVAVAVNADLEVDQPRLPYPLHMKSDEIVQLGPNLYESRQSRVFASQLPSDPGLTIAVQNATLEEVETVRRTIFGFPYVDRETGQPQVVKQRIFRGRNVILRVNNVPVFYLPYIQGDPADPLGPLEQINFNYNGIFGFQALTSWNVYDLIGVDPVPGTRWRFHADVLTKRGPALGTDFDFAGRDIFGIPSNYQGLIKAYGMYDGGEDVLGADRGNRLLLSDGSVVPINHPNWRGRFLGKMNVQDMPYGFSVLTQGAIISDRNFLEQFFNLEFNNGLDQDTYVYAKQQNENWAWSVLAQPRFHNWVTETEWYPKVDGYLLGQSVLDYFTYNASASIGYGQLRPANVPPPVPNDPTTVQLDSGRLDFYNEISAPLSAGPFRVVPYAVGDISYYTNDIFGNDVGRVLGGGGVRGSIPFSRLYPDTRSQLFNLNGMFHKIAYYGNYYIAHSNRSMLTLPQLDRLNDDASDQALRDIAPQQKFINPGNAAFLTNSLLFNPQIFALRRLIDNRIDTRDSIHVLQGGIRQRWQTKRGFPGNQHIIDWMTLDIRGSFFPNTQRDNFGEVIGVLEYDWVWNVGDRTALLSSGWFEPIDDGPRVVNFGVNLNRIDRTNFYLGYRHIDPLESRAVVASVTFPFNAKYAITGSTVYDFGVDYVGHSVVVTRIGTDFQTSFGFNYNSVLSTFGVTFNIVPNLLPTLGQGIGSPAGLAQQSLGR